MDFIYWLAVLIVTAAKSTRRRMNKNLILDFRPGQIPTISKKLSIGSS